MTTEGIEMQEYLENKTFDDIKIGDSASLTRVLSKKDILLFAIMSGDVNPAHLDEEYARHDFFHQIVAHGMWSASLISTVLGTLLPGPGTIYLNQSLKFLKPVLVGDEITVKVTVTEKMEEKHRVRLDCVCFNQNGADVVQGAADVIAPMEKVKLKRMPLPSVEEILRGI
jgi:acyl dehydratase